MLIILLIASSFAHYFMDAYHVVIDHEMLLNAMQTNMHESLDLLTMGLVWNVLLLGVLPAYFVYKIKIVYKPFKSAVFEKFKVLLVSLLVIVLMLLSFSKFYTSFFREHKPLRYYTNPTYWIYSFGKYLSYTFNDSSIVLAQQGLDAKKRTVEGKRKLVIMVVGEAARADHFSLNGYKRKTNPLLENEDIINFTQVSSCGTSTAYSVPCMFSMFGRDDYDYKKGISNENILDVLSHTNDISVLWRDNNSDSKGVALRVGYENYRTPEHNTMCQEGECRDEGMLVGLEEYIQTHQEKDILIVLHQMGNHGPAYYKRYPKAYEVFTPTCQTNQLEKCKQEEIINAYDNAILYTDYFLSRVIGFLKGYDASFETAMLYMSDHGESLGENGVYLHGLPYFMAPDAQTHIAALMWANTSMKETIHFPSLKKHQNDTYSQDNLFHTLLGLFDVNTSLYRPKLDVVHGEK